MGHVDPLLWQPFQGLVPDGAVRGGCAADGTPLYIGRVRLGHRRLCGETTAPLDGVVLVVDGLLRAFGPPFELLTCQTHQLALGRQRLCWQVAAERAPLPREAVDAAGSTLCSCVEEVAHTPPSPNVTAGLTTGTVGIARSRQGRTVHVGYRCQGGGWQVPHCPPTHSGSTYQLLCLVPAAEAAAPGEEAAVVGEAWEWPVLSSPTPGEQCWAVVPLPGLEHLSLHVQRHLSSWLAALDSHLVGANGRYRVISIQEPYFVVARAPSLPAIAAAARYLRAQFGCRQALLDYCLAGGWPPATRRSLSCVSSDWEELQDLTPTKSSSAGLARDPSQDSPTIAGRLDHADATPVLRSPSLAVAEQWRARRSHPPFPAATADTNGAHSRDPSETGQSPAAALLEGTPPREAPGCPASETPWRKCLRGDGAIYYWNVETGAVQWSPPEGLAGLPDVIQYDWEVVRQVRRQKDVLGGGGGGTVYRGALVPGGPEVAVKVITVSEGRKQVDKFEFQREIDVVTRVRHPNVAPILGYAVDPTGYRAALIGPLYDGSLQDRLGDPGLGWMDRVRILLDVAQGLCALHGAPTPIIHRDVKPGNVLLQGASAVVCDFGLALLSPELLERSSAVASVRAGTPGFIAPEALLWRKVGPFTDTYSFGVTALLVYCGAATPDDPTHDHVTRVPRLLLPNPFHFPAEAAAALLALAEQCVQDEHHYARRPAMRDVVAALTPLIPR